MTAQSSINEDTVGIGTLICKIKHYSYHSDPTKRLAAALIFNNIYTILREEEAIYSVYWLQFLHCFISNLALTEPFEELGCLSHVLEAIDHVERVLIEKAHVFNLRSSKRKKPPGFKDSLLGDAVLWLFDHITSPNSFCRKRCARLFVSLVKLSNVALVNFVSTDKVELCEELLHSDTEVILHDAGALVNWMSDLSRALDVRIFLNENGMLPRDNILHMPEFQTVLTRFFEIYPTPSTTLKGSTVEIQYVQELKRTLVVSIINYFLLRYKAGDMINFITFKFWEMVFDYVMEVDVSNEDAEQLVTKLVKYNPPYNLRNFIAIFNSHDFVNCGFNTNIHITLRQKLFSEKLLMLQAGTLSSVLPWSTYATGWVISITNALFETSMDGNTYAVDPAKSNMDYFETQLLLATYDDKEFTLLIDKLFETNLAYTNSGDILMVGEVILNILGEAVYKSITRKWNLFIRQIILYPYSTITHKIIVGVLNHLMKINCEINSLTQNGESRNKLFQVCDMDLKQMTFSILNNWAWACEYFNKTSNGRIEGIDILGKISNFMMQKAKFEQKLLDVYKWVVASLKYSGDWLPEYLYTFKKQVVCVVPLVEMTVPEHHINADLQ